MKHLLICITTLLLLSCNYGIYNYTKPMVDEDIVIDMEKVKEVTRISKRITKHCSEPIQRNDTLIVNYDQLQCKRKILWKEYGFIPEKYRDQIDKQLR